MSTTVPAPASVDSAMNSPVPCMSGHAGRQVPARLPGAGRGDRVGRLAAGAGHLPQRAVQVVVAPHHALGHAGRAAGVEEEQVVAVGRRGRPRPRRATRPRAPPRTRRPVSRTAAVGVVEAVDRVAHDVGERGVVDDGAGVAVVEHVPHLVGDVPVVHVHGHGAEQERREERLEVLGPVRHVERDLVAGASRRPTTRCDASRAARSANSAHVTVRSPQTSAARSGTSAAIRGPDGGEAPSRHGELEVAGR